MCICNISRYWLCCLGPFAYLLPKLFFFYYLAVHLIIFLLIVPDKGYTRNTLCTLNIIFTFSLFFFTNGHYRIIPCLGMLQLKISVTDSPLSILHYLPPRKDHPHYMTTFLMHIMWSYTRLTIVIQVR